MRRLLVVSLAAAGCTSAPLPSGPAPIGNPLTVQHCRAVPFEAVPASPATAATAPGAPPTPPPPPAPLAKVAGEATVGAGGDAAAIRPVLADALGAVRRCYEHTLENVPGLEGKLTVAIRIQPGGQVASAEGRTGFHPGVTACVEEVVRALRFPARPKGEGKDAAKDVEVTWPLVFRLPDDAPPAPAAATPPAAPTSVPPPATGPTPTSTTPVFPGTAGDYAASIIAPAIELRADAIAGCARPKGSPVQLGFEVTVAVRGPVIADAAVDGLVDPNAELCIAGVLRGTALTEAPSAPTGVRCQMLLRPR